MLTPRAPVQLRGTQSFTFGADGEVDAERKGGRVDARQGFAVEASQRAGRKAEAIHKLGLDPDWKELSAVKYDDAYSTWLITAHFPAYEAAAKKLANDRSSSGVEAVYKKEYLKLAGVYSGGAKRVAQDQVKTHGLEGDFNGWVTMAKMSHPAWLRVESLSKELGFWIPGKGVQMPELDKGEVDLAKTAYKEGKISVPTTEAGVTTRLDEYQVAVSELTAAHADMRPLFAEHRIADLRKAGEKDAKEKARIERTIQGWTQIGAGIDTVVGHMTAYATGEHPLQQIRDRMVGAQTHAGLPGVTVDDLGNIEVSNPNKAQAALQIAGSQVAEGGLVSKLVSGGLSMYYKKDLQKVQQKLDAMAAAVGNLKSLQGFSREAAIRRRFKNAIKKLEIAVTKLDKSVTNRREQFKTLGNKLDAYARDKANRAKTKAALGAPVKKGREAFTPKLMLIEAMREAYTIAKKADDQVPQLKQKAAALEKFVGDSRDYYKGKWGKCLYSEYAAMANKDATWESEKAVIDHVRGHTKSFRGYWESVLPDLQKWEQRIQAQMAQISPNVSGKSGEL